MKYVKRNALAGRSFASFHALEEHLRDWTREADCRMHGSVFERPIDRFERDEAAALRPLPALPLPARQQRLTRRVANDSFIDVDTVRYSVPHRLVRDRVEVALGEQEVRIFHGTTLVATHRRSFEPHARVLDARHYDGLWRSPETVPSIAPREGGLAAYGRSLHDYEAVLSAEALS